MHLRYVATEGETINSPKDVFETYETTEATSSSSTRRTRGEARKLEEEGEEGEELGGGGEGNSRENTPRLQTAISRDINSIGYTVDNGESHISL